MDTQREFINSNECQYASLKGISEGDALIPPAPLMRRLTLAVRRYLTPRQDRILHQRVNAAIEWVSGLVGNNGDTSMPVSGIRAEPLMPGDMVRVKSLEDIKATLNHLGQSRGCAFIADIMTPYCGTVQRVLKPMERFVDERDLRVKRCKGLVLLDGVMCEGTTVFGSCDRSCFMFWREEWLEKLA